MERGEPPPFSDVSLIKLTLFESVFNETGERGSELWLFVDCAVVVVVVVGVDDGRRE